MNGSSTILNIVLCLITRGEEILLLRRTQEPYRGCWALPGGKMHFGETAAVAARREAEEETGLNFSAAQIRVAGCATEAIVNAAGEIAAHFVMFPVTLTGGAGKARAGREGELAWFRLSELEELPELIPTDRELIGMYLSAEPVSGVPHFSVREENGRYELTAVGRGREVRSFAAQAGTDAHCLATESGRKPLCNS